VGECSSIPGGSFLGDGLRPPRGGDCLLLLMVWLLGSADLNELEREGDRDRRRIGVEWRGTVSIYSVSFVCRWVPVQ
jgi:hypothetical protein